MGSRDRPWTEGDRRRANASEGEEARDQARDHPECQEEEHAIKKSQGKKTCLTLGEEQEQGMRVGKRVLRTKE